MRKVLPSSFQQRASEDLHDPRLMNNYTQKAFGVDADYLDTALKALMQVSQGRMPSASEMPTILQAARQRYGWSDDRTRAELRKAIAQPDASSRIHAYLGGNGASKVDNREYEVATKLTSEAIKFDLQLGIEDRLAKGDGNNAPRDTFSGMTASKRVIDHTRNSQDIRNRLNILTGNSKPQTYQAKVAAVTEARLRLADRLDYSAQKHDREGTEPTLRETLKNTYDLQVVSDASEDVGMENPRDVAEERWEAETSHMTDESYDVTENLRD